MMGYAGLILLVLASSMIPERRKEEELSTVATRECERIPLHEALSTLEEVVKEEKAIEEFCYKHYDFGQKTISENRSEPCDMKPANCADLYNGGMKLSGVYNIHVAIGFSHTREITVYCDMETDGGGWTVFQRRGPFSHQINFTRNWYEYAYGFGNLREEFWLGNDLIHTLTYHGGVVLRIDLGDFNGNRTFALYKGFIVENYEKGYKMDYGSYSGDAGDSLTGHHKGKIFVTYDRDNARKCAKHRRGGWWYGSCANANLNGEYNNTQGNKGILWYGWLGNSSTLMWTEMKVRTESFDLNRTMKLC